MKVDRLLNTIFLTTLIMSLAAISMASADSQDFLGPVVMMPPAESHLGDIGSLGSTPTAVPVPPGLVLGLSGVGVLAATSGLKRLRKE